jgi:hypothetical protein
MPEEPKPAEPDQPVAEPAPESEQQEEEDVGEFINRHVFERDSVFFEG